jgi:hypothetical protein
MRTEALISVSDASHVLRVSESNVRWAADRGKLPCRRDSAGRRLFRLGDLLIYRRIVRRKQRRLARRTANHAA